MVCLKQPHILGMTTSSYAREVVNTCNQSQCRMQAICDLLLLSSDVRPVTTDTLAVFRESYSKCRETVITRTKGLLVLTGRINDQLHDIMSKWQDICVCVGDMAELLVGLIECCAHAAYLVAISKPGCFPALPGIVDNYKVLRANCEVQLSCKHFRQSSINDLTPPVLVQICSRINKNLTVLTECCKSASEQSSDIYSQEQFKLCVKSFTASASCLLSGIRCFKANPSQVHYGRCIGFYDALVSSTNSLVNFATEEGFIGKPALLSAEGIEAKKCILGGCLSVVSSVVQLCKVIRELAYNSKDLAHRDKVALCIDTISKSSSQLAESLLQHNTAEASKSSTVMPSLGGNHGNVSPSLGGASGQHTFVNR